MTDETEQKLSKKHQLFVDEYLKCFNATEAYSRVYPSARRDSARASAAELLANPNIMNEIRLRLAEVHMSADEALKLTADIARGDIAALMDVNSMGFSLDMKRAQELGLTRLIKKVKQRTTTKIGKTADADDTETHDLEIEMYDAQAALRDILKVHGRFAENRPLANQSPILRGIPVGLIGPSFFDIYRDIERHRHTEYILKGGRGGLKSSFVSLVIPWLLIDDPKSHALVVRQVKETLRDSVFSQIQWAVDQLGLTDSFKFLTSPLEIEYLPTGQKIYFRGANEPAKIKSIKPPFGYIKILWFEELDQFHGPEAVRNIEQSAIRGGDEAFIFKSFNPPRTAANWANKYCLIPKDTQYQHTSDYRTVPPEWLGRTFLDEAAHLQAVNPKAYEHEYLGIANGNGGQVFENVVIREITDDEIAQFDHVLHGLDWGFTVDPASYGRMHYDAARRKLYIFGEVRSWRKGNEDLYNELVAYGLRPDDLIIADSAEPKSVADFRQFGANCRGAEKGKDSVKYSMRWLQGLTEIVIDPKRAPYHADEFINYEYERTKDGEIISAFPDANNHAIDDVRYATNLIWRQRGQ